MSHFTTIVIVPKDTKNTSKAVEELMAPFEEELHTEFEIKFPVSEIVAEKAKIIEENKDYLVKEDKLQEYENMTPEQVIDSWYGYEVHDGNYGYWHNPNAKWDWYVVGGRWGGDMTGKPRDDNDGGFNSEDEFHQLAENSCKVADIDPKFVPFAVVTPDGEWHEKGEMLWFALVKDEKQEDDWETEYRNIISEYGNHIAVLCDVHI